MCERPISGSSVRCVHFNMLLLCIGFLLWPLRANPLTMPLEDAQITGQSAGNNLVTVAPPSAPNAALQAAPTTPPIELRSYAQAIDKVLRASSFDGEDFGAQVNACLAAIATAGGGTCDARNYPPTNYAAQNIVVGDGLHSVTLILPVGVIIFAEGKQLLYRSQSNIIGQGIGYYKHYGLPPGSGSTIDCSGATVMCVAPYAETSETIDHVHLENFSIQSEPPSATPGAGSVGLAIGGGPKGVDVLSSRFEYLNIGGFDIGTQMGGAHGCTCYNEINQVYSRAKSYGVSTVNFSKYVADVNSNTWIAGTAWGEIGLSDVGGSKNRWIGIDIEGAKTHGMVLGGYGNSVISPYEEANGCDLINGNENMVIGPLSYGGGAWQPCPESRSTTSFWLGPDAAPKTIGTKSGLVFGSPKMYDDGYNSQFTLLAGNALDLKYSGDEIGIYGRNGHAPLSVGNLEATSGITATGKSSLQALPNPPAPVLTAIGGTGTTYTYYIVGHDRNGGTTLPSHAARVSGPAVLGTVLTAIPKRAGSGYVVNDVVRIAGNGSDGNATARVTSVASGGAVTGLQVLTGGKDYASISSGNVTIFTTTGGSGTGLEVTVQASHVVIVPPVIDGVYCVDVLKTDINHMLPATIGDIYGCGVHNALPNRLDFGQVTQPYTAPSRNNTGDLSVAGQAIADKYCIGGISVCWMTTTVAPTGACTNGSIDTNTTNGAFYVCQSKVWVEK